MSTRIKICGLTNLADAERSVELGAWALGMIFYRRSPRYCNSESALEIVSTLRREVELCGVFVNAKLERITDLAERLELSMVQLHGDEGPVFCSEVARRTGCKVIKAARIRLQSDVVALKAFHTNYHLLDSHIHGVRGGSGQTFEWKLVSGGSAGVPMILSGGLNAGNVAEGIRRTRPYAVDVASGVEAEPGKKDSQKLEEFFTAVASWRDLTTGSTA